MLRRPCAFMQSRQGPQFAYIKLYSRLKLKDDRIFLEKHTVFS